MTDKLYTFVGATAALKYRLKFSEALDRDKALFECEKLQSVGEQLIIALSRPDNEESFEQLLDERIGIIMNAIGQIRLTRAYELLNTDILDILQHFFSFGRSLMGLEDIPIHPSSHTTSHTD